MGDGIQIRFACSALWALSFPAALAAQGAGGDAVKFFAPHPAYRQLEGARALLNFSLQAVPEKAVEIAILNSNGAAVCALAPVSAHAGLNRVTWDLRHEPPRLVELRTTPPENLHIWEDPRFRNAETRPITHKGIEQAQLGPIAAPGLYTVRLTVDGQTYQQSLEILRPPDSHGSDADLQSSVRLQLRLRDDISTVSDMTNQIERMRRQLEDQRKTIAAPAGSEALLQAMDAIDGKLQEVEYRLISRSDALSDEKYYVEAAKLYLNLLWLNGTMGTGTGKYAGSADYGQTETALGLLFDLEKQVLAVQEDYKNLMQEDVATYNRSIATTGIRPLSIGK